MRVEKDSIGEFRVPAGAYWGINAGRAAENFPVSGRKINPRLISAYCQIKKAAAAVNMRAGLLMFAVSVLHIGVVDIAGLAIIYKIISFILMGLMLLGVSYVYTRFMSVDPPGPEQ